MSAFSTLAGAAINTQRGALGAHPTQAVAGASWKFDSPVWNYDVNSPVDFSAAGTTCTCEVVDNTGTVVLSAPTQIVFAGSSAGTFTLTVDESITASVKPGRYSWSCLISDGTDVVPFWQLNDSPFLVTAA